MSVDELVNIFRKVAGLPEYWAKVAVYYADATHRIDQYDWIPVLAFIGPPGTGKSKCLDIMRRISNKPYTFSCHATMRAAGLRNELESGPDKVTAIIEECDLYPNHKELESYLINRVDKERTSNVAVNEQYEDARGMKKWRISKKQMWGPTVMHDRNSLGDLAAESRAITIPTRLQNGPFDKQIPSLTPPNCGQGTIPDWFDMEGRAFDTWKPLLESASAVGDDGWLAWAWQQIQEAIGNLRDGHSFEQDLAIFAQVVSAYCDETGLGGMVKMSHPQPLVIQSSVVEPLKKQGLMVTPQIVRQVLTKMGLDVRRHGGKLKLFTTEAALKKIAKNIGYEDEVLS